MAASPQHHTLRLIAPPLPLRRRRSRLGEPTVVYELVIVDGATTFGRELHRRQARAVRDALQWFADHTPDGEPLLHDRTAAGTARTPDRTNYPGLGAPLTCRLAPEGITVIEVPAKLASRMRLLSSGHVRKRPG